ncbi:uncharacterized protein N7525_006426 [Penicillium rubens]|nr:uncharacterized protein N7525_006426 [Penicillium rubens]KAJ5828173.1 hypothetical protein N7525_006426 [Penicillium rubens]
MHPRKDLLTDVDPSRINIIREITRSDASSIFEVDLDGQRYALKLFHDNGDPGYTEKGRDLNRFRCESNAYKKLPTSGVCDRSFVPKFYGYIDRVDPAIFHPALKHFAQDKLKPRAILLEYLPNAESLNCVNYVDTLYPQAIKGMKEIHRAGVHHRDVYPRNLLVRGNPDRLVWIDFDVATTFTDFGPQQLNYCDHEIALVKGLGEVLIKLRDFLQIQIFIKGIMILPQNNEETLHLLATSTISAKPSKMNIVSLIKPLLISLNEADIPVCVIGEVVLNYYNVPRVVHDIEICVPELSLPEVVSNVSSTTELERVEVKDYDLFTEYKRGFPTFKASNTSLRLIVFPDTHFGIAPLRQSIVPSDERASTACSKQILDLVPQCEVQDLPIPRLPNLFTGLCSRLFESGNLMARIAVEQLVDGMNLDDDWIESNLGGATIKVRNLAAQLVLEKGFRHEEDMALGAMHSDFDAIRMQDLSSIPGSGF